MTMAMLWYLLLAGLAVGMFGAIFTDAALRHRRYMKALEVLRSYADKGIEPPAAVTALLLQPAAESADLSMLLRCGRCSDSLRSGWPTFVVVRAVKFWRLRRNRHFL